MATMTMHSRETNHIHPIRIVIAIIIGIIMLTVAITLYHHNHQSHAGAQPTNQTNQTSNPPSSSY